MPLFRFILRTSWPLVLLAALAGTVSGVGNVGLLGLIHAALSRGGAAGSGLIAAFAGLCVVVLVARSTSQALLVRLGQRAVYRLWVQMSRRIVAVPLRRLEELGPHRILAALTDDVIAISQAFNLFPTLCINIAVAACCLAYLAWLSPAVSAVVVAFFGLGFLSHRLLAARAIRHLRSARAEHDTLLGHFRGLIEGIKELKLHAARREAFLGGLLEASAASVRDSFTTGHTLFAAAGGWSRLLFLACIGLVLFAVPAWRPIEPQTLTGCTLTLLFVLSPLDGILSNLNLLSRARVALEKFEALGLTLQAEAREEEADLAQAKGLQPLGVSADAPGSPWHRLELRGVTHTYRREQEDETFVLGPINLRLRPGELVFLTGGNGSGKTTLAKLLTGLYVPQQGEILRDGKPVARPDGDGYRRLFSAIFSDFYLFESLPGLGGVGLDGRAREYLKLLHLDGVVRVQDGRLSTTELSRGQRKRLALLSAYLEDRPICVFDEWAADQDPVFKKVFYTELLPELRARGKAVVVISHDEQYYGVAERILKLVEGKLQEGAAGPPTRNGPLLAHS